MRPSNLGPAAANAFKSAASTAGSVATILGQKGIFGGAAHFITSMKGTGATGGTLTILKDGALAAVKSLAA